MAAFASETSTLTDKRLGEGGTQTLVDPDYTDFFGIVKRSSAKNATPVLILVDDYMLTAARK